MGKNDGYYARLGKWVARGVPLPVAAMLATGTDREHAENIRDTSSAISPSGIVGDVYTALGEPPNPDSPPMKARRKASAYNKEYKKQFSKLKKKHPKTAFKTLVKRAHKETKKIRGRKK